VAVHAPGPQARHEDAATPERDFSARATAADGAPRGIGNVLGPAELLAILLHHRVQHLLAGVETEAEERGARLGEDVEQRQRHLHRGHGWGREPFPSDRSCASLLHRRLPSEGCGDHRPTGRQQEPPLLFQPVSSTGVGTFPTRRPAPRTVSNTATSSSRPIASVQVPRGQLTPRGWQPQAFGDQRSPSLRRPLGHLCDRHGDQNAPTWRVGHSAALDSSPGGLHTQRARAR
jgi:hypothetical protein